MITVERLEQFIRDFLSRMHVESLIHGNANQSHAIELASLVEQKLNSTQANTLPLLSRQLLLKREYKLVPGESYRFETENEFHKSSCVELYLQCGVQNDMANVHIDLASQILAEPCYNTLRTKEQLGYIVFCGSRKANGVQGIRFIVQSTKHPEYVEGRIELFLNGMTVSTSAGPPFHFRCLIYFLFFHVFFCLQEQLETMTDEEFERHKEALAAQKLEKPKRLSTLFNKFLNEISLQQYHFDRAEKEVTILRTITKQRFLDYYRNYILAKGVNRQALSIHILSTAEGGIGSASPSDEASATPMKQEADEYLATQPPPTIISDLAVFKSSKELYPIVQPYIAIQPKGGKSKL